MPWPSTDQRSKEVRDEHNQLYGDRAVADVAAEWGMAPLDVMMIFGLNTELETVFESSLSTTIRTRLTRCSKRTSVPVSF